MGFPLVDESWIMDDQWVIKRQGHEVAGVCSRIAQPALHGNIFQSLSAALGALHPEEAHVLDEETFRPRTRPLFSTSCSRSGWTAGVEELRQAHHRLASQGRLRIA